MHWILGNKDKATVTLTVECFACHKLDSVSFDCSFQKQDALNYFVEKGWLRRQFHEMTGKIWFCSEQCGFHSKKVSWLELYWQDFVEKEKLAKRPFWKKLLDWL